MLKYLLLLKISLAILCSLILSECKPNEECYMPEGCEWFETEALVTERNLYCRSLYAKFDRPRLTNTTYSICQPRGMKSPKAGYFKIHFNRDKFRRKYTLNNSFQLFKIGIYIGLENYHTIRYLPDFVFYNLKGFQADLTFKSNKNSRKRYRFMIAILTFIPQTAR